MNSGVNGSTLRVPFFRAVRADVDYPRSLNAVYYQADYMVNHLIVDSEVGNMPADYPVDRSTAEYTCTNVNTAAQWKLVTRTSGTYLIYYTDDPTPSIAPDSYVEPQTPNAHAGALFCDGEPLVVGDLVGVILGHATSGEPTDQATKGGIYEVALIPDTDGGSTMIFALKRRNTLAP